MRRLGSLVMRVADEVRVPAGAALAVDREQFAEAHDRRDRGASADSRRARRDSAHSASTAEMSPVIVATGPLTSSALSADIAAFVGREHLAFFDAISPIVLAETIDMTKVFRAVAVGSKRWDPRSKPRPRRQPEVAPRATTSTVRFTKDEYRRVSRGDRLRREGRRPRLRQHEVLRGLSADRSHGASRRRHAALRADEAGRACTIRGPAAGRTRSCSCGRTTSPAITSASSDFRRS